VRRFFVKALLLVTTGVKGARASPIPSFVSVLTISIALVLVGAFGLLVRNMEQILDDFGEDLRVTAFLEKALPLAEQEAVAERVRSVEGVASVTLVSEAEALERFRRSVGGADLLEGLEENPLPASLDIALLPASRSAEGLAIVEGALDGLPGVAELAFGQEWMEGYARATTLVRSAAIALGLVLSGAALLIVANTIRLGVYARRDELEILGLVGAGPVFVRVPFLVEGTLQGLAGGALAVLLLYGAFQVWVPQVEYGLALFLGNAHPEFFGATGVGRVVLGGAGLGLLGSSAALVGWRS